MTATYTYDGDALLTVRRNSASFQEVADYGRVGSGSITLNDAPGTLSIVGHKEFIAEESACSFARTLTGYIGERNIRRNTERTGGGRELETALLDLNARLAFYVIRGKAWKRPEETIEDRLTALLASAFLSPLVADNGLVEYPTDLLDANDYRGQFPADVLRDMALEVGFNFFVYPDDGIYEPSLWFKNSNVSVAFSSTLRLSNDLADVDHVTTFPVSFTDTSLKRDPAQVFSGVFMPYQKGYVFRARAATSLAFEPRHGVAPNAQVKKRAKAITLADKFLFTRRNEEDTVTTKVQLPADKVNLILAGQRIQAKFTDFGPEGYDSFNWWRVVDRTVHPLLRAVAKYDLDLTLSPQEASCSVQPTFVQYKWQETDAQLDQANWTWRASLDAPSTPGNLIVLAFIGDDLNTGTLVSVPTGWTSVFHNYNMKADNTGDWCHLLYKKSQGESYVDLRVTGSARGPRVMFMEYAGLTNPVQSGTENKLRQVGLGYANVTDTSYPSGPSAVLSICYMHTGPESGDALAVDGTNHSLRTPQDSGSMGYFGSPVIGVGDYLRDGASGATSSWRFLFTNDEETLTVGIVFVGDNCA